MNAAMALVEGKVRSLQQIGGLNFLNEQFVSPYVGVAIQGILATELRDFLNTKNLSYMRKAGVHSQMPVMTRHFQLMARTVDLSNVKPIELGKSMTEKSFPDVTIRDRWKGLLEGIHMKLKAEKTGEEESTMTMSEHMDIIPHVRKRRKFTAWPVMHGVKEEEHELQHFNIAMALRLIQRCMSREVNQGECLS